MIKCEHSARNEILAQLQDRSWVNRCDVLDYIARNKLVEYTEITATILQRDSNIHVRCYALQALYELSPEKAQSLIRHHLHDKNISLRLTALALNFLSTSELYNLLRIRKVVTRKNCDYHHQYLIFNIFRYYGNVENIRPILELLEDILSATDSKSGIHKDIKVYLLANRQ